MAERNIQLDGLRGIAAVVVVVYHLIIALDESQMERVYYADFNKLTDLYSVVSKLILRVFDGQAAVFLFFVLSGAVLFQSLARDGSQTKTLILNFVIRRLARIYPAVIVCVALVSTLLFLIGHPSSIVSVIKNMLLVAYNLNIPMWTLGVEVIAIPFMIAAFLGYRYGRLAGLIFAIFALEVLSRAIGVNPALGQIQQYWLHFALGMLVPTAVGVKISEFLPRSSWVFFVALILVFKSTIQLVAIWLLIICVFYQHAGTLGSILARKVPAFLGRISYGVYLYHYIFVTLAASSFRDISLAAGKPIEYGIALSLPTLALTIVAATLSTILIEEPVIRLARQVASHRRKPRAKLPMAT